MSSIPDMSVKEAAAYLKMGEGAVYELASESAPPARKIRCYRFGANGGRIRFRRADLDEWVERQADAPAPQRARAPSEYRHLDPARMAALRDKWAARAARTGEA